MVSPAKKELRTSPQRKNDKKRVQIYYSRTHQEEYYEQCLPLSLRSRIATSNNRSPVGCSINSIHKQDMRPNHVLPTAGETSELISQVQTIEQSRNVNVCLSDSHDRVNMGIPRQLGGPNASGDNCIIIHSCTIENADDVRFDNQQSPKQAVIPSGSSFTSSVMKPSQRRVPFFWGAVLPKGVNANVNNGLKLKLSPVSASHTFEENDENFKCHISSCDSVLEKYETRSLDCVEESTNVTYTTRFHTRLKDNIETSKEIIRKKVVEQKEENSQINRDRVSLDSSEVNEKTEGPCSSNSQVVMDNETFTRRYNKMALRNRKTISGYPECPCCRSAEGNKVHRHDNMSEHLVSSSNCESPCRLSRMASRRFSMATVYHVKEQLPVSRQHSLSHNGKVDVHLESEKKEEDSPSTSKEDSNSVTRSVAVSCLMEDIKLKMKAVVLLNRLSPVIENIPKRKMESETSKVNSVLKKNVCQSSSCIPVDTSSKSLTSTKRQKCIKIEEIASSGQQHSLGCYSECEATVRGTDYGVVPDHGMKRQRRSGLRSKQTEYYPVISNSLTETINSEETFNRNVSQPNNSAVADNSTSCLSPVKHPQSGEVESDSRSGTVQETLANFNTNECLLKSHYAIVSRKRSLQRSAKLECCSATSESHPETLNEKEALNLNVSPANHFTVTNTSPSSLSPVNPPKCRKGETTKDGQLDSLVSDSESEPVKEGLGSFFTTETPLKSKDVKKLRSRHTKLDYSVLSDIEQLTTNSEDVLRQNASQPKNSTFSDKSSSFLSSTKRLKCRKVGEISASEQLESFDDDSEITETETSLKPKHVIKNKRISGRRSTKMKPHSSINDGELKSFNSQETLNRQVLSSSCDIIGMKRKHSACEKVEDDGERGVELSTVSVSVVEGNSQNELKLDEKQTYHDVQKVGKAKRRSVSLTKKLKSFIHRENNESRAPKKNLKLGKNAHHPNNSPVTNSSIQNNIFHQSRSDVEGATCLPLKSLKRGTVSEVVSATQFDDNEKSPNLRKVAKTKKSPVDRNNKSESFNSVHDSKTEALITNMTVLENSQPCTRSVTKTRSSSSGSSINPSRYRTRQQSGASHLLSDSGDELASKANLKVCKTKKLDMSPNLCRNRAKSGGQVEKRETPQISHSESERSDEIRHRLCNRSLFIDSGSNLIHPEFNNSERVLNSPNIAKTQRSVTGLRSVDSNPTDDCERDILNNKLTAESVQLLTSSSTDDCSVIFKNNRATRAKGKKTQKSLGRRRVQCLGSDSGSEVTRDSQLDTHEKSFILPTTTRIKRLVRKSRKARMLNYTDSSESDCLVEKCTSNETALQENNAVIENSTSNVLLTGSKRGEAEECTKELLFDSVVKDTETDMNDSKKISPNSTTNSELHDLDKVGQICCHEPEVLDGCIREQSACTIEENSFNPTRNHSKNPDGEGSVVSTNEVVNQTSSTFDSNEMLMDLKTTTENKSNSVNRFRTGTSCSQNNDSESEILKCCPKSGSTRRTPPTVNNKQQAPGNLPYLTTDFEGLCLREMPLNHLEECIEAVVKRNAESDDDHGPPGAHMEERHCNLHEVLSEKSLHQVCNNSI